MVTCLVARGVKGVVHDPLGGIEFVIVLETQMPEAFGNGVESGRLRSWRHFQPSALLLNRCMRASKDHDPAPTMSRKIDPRIIEKSVRPSCAIPQSPYWLTFGRLNIQ